MNDLFCLSLNIFKKFLFSNILDIFIFGSISLFCDCAIKLNMFFCKSFEFMYYQQHLFTVNQSMTNIENLCFKSEYEYV